MSRVQRSFRWACLATVMLAGAAQAQNPRLTLSGGLASGDNGFDMGPALAASFNWRIADAPFNLRVDPYFAYHSTDSPGPDGSLWFLGASGNLELAFRPAGTSAEPYIFGGGGFYMRNISIDVAGPNELDDSEMKGGLGFGGGLRFGGFTLEARMHDIDEFTNVSFLVGFRLGG